MNSTKNTSTWRQLAAVAIMASPLAAMATNGYMPHGIGIKSKGMAGASVAMTDNAFAGANNPAAAAWAGNRGEVGADFFMPKRSMARTGGMLDTAVESGKEVFLIPEFGYNMAISDKMGVGITVYGNGGMNTDFPGANTRCFDQNMNPYQGNALCGTGNLGVDLMQLIIAPTIAYKFDERHSVGVSPLLVYQQFKAYGLQAFAGMSSDSCESDQRQIRPQHGFGCASGLSGQVE